MLTYDPEQYPVRKTLPGICDPDYPTNLAATMLGDVSADGPGSFRIDLADEFLTRRVLPSLLAACPTRYASTAAYR
jgi:hypothetical protein